MLKLNVEVFLIKVIIPQKNITNNKNEKRVICGKISGACNKARKIKLRQTKHKTHLIIKTSLTIIPSI